MLLRWATVWLHNRHGLKSGGRLLCPFLWGELGRPFPWRELVPNLTQCRLGWGLPPYQVAPCSIQPFGHNTLMLQTDRHDKQWSHSIWRTITCSGRPIMSRRPVQTTIHLHWITCYISVHGESKKGATLTMAITLSILGGFAKFFNCCKEQ